MASGRSEGPSKRLVLSSMIFDTHAAEAVDSKSDLDWWDATLHAVVRPGGLPSRSNDYEAYISLILSEFEGSRTGLNAFACILH
jgi:hypothetical protein